MKGTLIQHLRGCAEFNQPTRVQNCDAVVVDDRGEPLPTRQNSDQRGCEEL